MSRVVTELDFIHLDFLEQFKAMPAGRQQHDIAALQDAAFQILLSFVEEIHAQSSLFQEKTLLGVLNISIYRIVEMCGNHFARRMAHVSELLRETSGRD